MYHFTSLWIFLSCLFRWLDWLNFQSHFEQLNGFSPVWILSWIFKLLPSRLLFSTANKLDPSWFKAINVKVSRNKKCFCYRCFRRLSPANSASTLRAPEKSQPLPGFKSREAESCPRVAAFCQALDWGGGHTADKRGERRLARELAQAAPIYHLVPDHDPFKSHVQGHSG